MSFFAYLSSCSSGNKDFSVAFIFYSYDFCDLISVEIIDMTFSTLIFRFVLPTWLPGNYIWKLFATLNLILSPETCHISHLEVSLLTSLFLMAASFSRCFRFKPVTCVWLLFPPNITGWLRHGIVHHHNGSHNCPLVFSNHHQSGLYCYSTSTTFKVVNSLLHCSIPSSCFFVTIPDQSS